VMTALSTPPPSAAATEVPGPAASSRRERIAVQLTSTLADLSGLDAARLDRQAAFTDLGFDSLFLTQANAQFRKRFGVRITLGQLFGETPTIDALAGRIDMELGPDVVTSSNGSLDDHATSAEPEGQGPAQPMDVAQTSSGNGVHLPADPVERLIAEQLRIMEEQLDTMRAHVAADLSLTAADP